MHCQAWQHISLVVIKVKIYFNFVLIKREGGMLSSSDETPQIVLCINPLEFADKFCICEAVLFLTSIYRSTSNFTNHSLKTMKTNKNFFLCFQIPARKLKQHLTFSTSFPTCPTILELRLITLEVYCPPTFDKFSEYEQFKVKPTAIPFINNHKGNYV